MPQHYLAEDMDHNFILKLVNAQHVEVAHKSWGNNIPTLADKIHSTHQLHNKKAFIIKLGARF
jgi:hypothetical protein